MSTRSSSTGSDDGKHLGEPSGFPIHLLFFPSHLPYCLFWSHGILLPNYYFKLFINDYLNINLLEDLFFSLIVLIFYIFYLPRIHNLYAVCSLKRFIYSLRIFLNVFIFSSHLYINLGTSLELEVFCFSFCWQSKMLLPCDLAPSVGNKKN